MNRVSGKGYGTMLMELDVQRTMKRAEMWALKMALTRLSGLADL